MSQSLSLRKLADIMHGATSLSHQPVWLLGAYYGTEAGSSSEAKVLDAECLEAMLADFRSRLWFTYRKDFPSLGPSMLTSDVGWGCTIRSGQMLLAETLARIALGRCWRRQPATLEEVQPVVGLFVDQPAALLSIHRICAAGVSAGIVPGRWVGPWMLCKSLEALFSPLQGGDRPMGLHLHVACGSGGGAPELDTTAIRAQMAAAAATSSADPTPLVSGSEQHGGGGAARGRRSSERPAQPARGYPQHAGETSNPGGGGCGAGPASTPVPGPGVPDGPSCQGDGDIRQAATAGGDASASRGDCADEQQRQRPEELSEGWVATPSPQGDVSATHGPPPDRSAATADEAPAENSDRKGGPETQLTSLTGPAAGPPPASASASGAAAEGAAAAGTPAAAVTANGHHNARGPASSAAACPGAGHATPGVGAAGCGPGSAEEVAAGQSGGRCRAEGAAGPSGRPAAPSPVLLLVPLTLGMDKINPVYLPQLQHILSWPQSVGIVGGRPSASLYLCGVQDNSLLYLDPHEAQPAVRWGTAAASGGSANGGESAGGPVAALPPAVLATYFCDTVRLLPAAALDPSMAIGFLCMGQEDLEDLFSRLDALAGEHSLAPLMTLTTGGRPLGAGVEDDFEESEGGAQPGGGQQQQLEEWELV